MLRWQHPGCACRFVCYTATVRRALRAAEHVPRHLRCPAPMCHSSSRAHGCDALSQNGVPSPLVAPIVRSTFTCCLRLTRHFGCVQQALARATPWCSIALPRVGWSALLHAASAREAAVLCVPTLRCTTTSGRPWLLEREIFILTCEKYFGKNKSQRRP